MKANIEKQYKILVVDDISINVVVLTKILEIKGYIVIGANNGKTAIDIAEKEDIDLILLDVMMPEMNGFEVCRKLKEIQKTKDIPVIFLTAKIGMDDIKEGFSSGGVDYISKPFNNQELLSRIKTHLELMQTRKNLSKVNQDLIQANLMKDKFLSIIAHDLKNPLGSVIASADLLNYHAMEMDRNEILKLSKIIGSTAQKTASLLDDLLIWARSQTGTISFNPKQIDLREITIENINFIENISNKKHITITSNINQELITCADKNMINTIFRNLLTNAVKFTPNGGSIEIFGIVKNEYLEISVKDTGVGMKQEAIDKLFKVDSIKSNRGTNKEIGTGLGLIITDEFIKKHKGLITVESEVGIGSNFIFSLPLRLDCA